MDLILFGMQGAGKGTLSKSLAKQFNLQIFETGAELRKLADQDSELGRKIKTIIEAGHLVSNEIVMEIVENFINNLTSNSPILFDGIPRKIEQAKTLNKLLDQKERNYKAVLVNISKETAIKRLTTRRIDPITKEVFPADYPNPLSPQGNTLVTRKDDTPEAIKTRLQTFEQETKPTIELYSDNLIIIDGEPAIEKVSEDAIKTLTPLF